MDERIALGVWCDPDRMSGAPCILHTRIRTKAVADFARAGYDLDGIQYQYPSLSAVHVANALAWEMRPAKERRAIVQKALTPPRSGHPNGGE
ncbi:MAG: DUF433 domain-containing protein [Sphingobium sp.]